MAENQAQSQINVNSIGRVTEEDIQDALHDLSLIHI